MKKSTLILSISLMVIVSFVSVVHGDVRLPKTFSDNAVLQRDVPVNVWGWADPAEKVTVTFGDKSASATACEQGKWMVKLPASSASFEGKELVIEGKNKVVFGNVVVGEVWVCGGQSNMEQPLNSWGQPRLSCTEEEITGDYSFIRYNRAAHLLAIEPIEDVVTTGWRLCKDGIQKDCTAVGFHFANRLHKELGVPVGLIDSNWGGSSIDWWMPEEGWNLLPELAACAARAKTAKEKFTSKEGYTAPIAGMDRKPYSEVSSDIIGSMYNAMMAPWTKYTIRGAIWYQGCSNTGEREFYYFKQKAMITQWRKIWNQGDFPFYWVQLANFQAPNDDPNVDGTWPCLRDGQTKCMEVANSGQAVIIDIGEEKDIHPRNKFDVGNRLARWALAKDFGKQINYQSPTFKGMAVEGNKVTLTFDHVGEGLLVGKKEGINPVVADTEGKLTRFAVAGADKKWYWANAVITGKNMVVLQSESVAEPVAVRYAWQVNPFGCNLYSQDGLPATPFRTDQW